LRGFVRDVAFLCRQNEEMVTEGELRSNLDDSEKVRELQDKVADMKAEVCKACAFFCQEL
jgi:DnaJ-domain-containing protein 1